MSDLGRYVRVYYSIRTDEKFIDIYPDDEALACWLRLLMIADDAYPQPAHIPLRVSKAGMKKLVAAQLITVLPNDMFRINGLDSERKRRAAPRAKAAKARWDSDASAMHMHSTSIANAMHAEKHESDDALLAIARAQHEHKQEHPALPASADALLNEDDDPHLQAWYRLTASWPSSKVTSWLDKLAADYGPGEVAAALGAVASDNGDRSTLISRAESLLRIKSRTNQRIYEQAVKDRQERDRKAIAEMPAEQRAENLRRLRDAMRQSGLIGPTDEGEDGAR